MLSAPRPHITAAAAVLVALLFVSAAVSLSALAMPADGSSPGAPLNRLAQADCTVEHAKRAGPPTVTLGSEVTITLTAKVSCPKRAEYLHVVIVQEESSAMAGPGGSAALELYRASVELVRHLAMPQRPWVYVGVVSFNDRAHIKSQLSNDESRVMQALRSFGGSGGSEIDRGLNEAERVLQRGRQHRPQDEIMPVVVLFSRGRDDNGCDQAVGAARSVKGKGTLVMTVCVGDDCDEACSRRIASSPRYAFDVSDMGPVKAAFDRVLELRTRQVRRLVITDTLSADVTYVADSAQPPPSRTSDAPIRWLAWETTSVPADGVTFTLRVRPQETGNVATNASAAGWLEDDRGDTQSWTFDMPSVHVLAPTPQVTPTRTSSPTPTDVPATLTPTPTATPDTPWIALPYVLRPPQ